MDSHGKDCHSSKQQDVFQPVEDGETARRPLLQLSLEAKLTSRSGGMFRGKGGEGWLRVLTQSAGPTCWHGPRGRTG